MTARFSVFGTFEVTFYLWLLWKIAFFRLFHQAFYCQNKEQKHNFFFKENSGDKGLIFIIKFAHILSGCKKVTIGVNKEWMQTILFGTTYYGLHCLLKKEGV